MASVKVGVYRWPYGVRRWFADCGCGWHGRRRAIKYHAIIDARRHSDTQRHNCRYPVSI